MAAEDRSGELREAAAHRGLKLVKSRRRKPGAGDYGRFGLTDIAGKKLFGFGPGGLTATAEDIAAYLRKGAAATWAESARATPARSKKSLEQVRAGKAEAEDVRAAKPRRRQAEKPIAEKEAELPPAPPAKPTPPPPALALRNAKFMDAEAIAALVGGDGQAIAATLRSRAPVLVADRGGVIGCVAWHIVPTLQRGVIGRITVVAVAEEERRQGIGTALIEAARARLAKQGCTFVEVMSEIELRNAHGFFRALGFRQSSYRFTID